MIQDKGYRGVTVGECLGDPEANWYRASSGKTVTSSSASPSATPSASGTSSAAPTATTTGTSQDGTCGSAVGLSCIGFSEGSCCSQYGYCGSTTNHCGTGCQSVFGTCGGSSNVPASSAAGSAAPTTTPSNLVTSPDATCGGTSGYTCIGAAEGECCSQYGYCGTTTDQCGTGCNTLFGNCSDSSVDSSSVGSVPSSETLVATSSTSADEATTTSTTTLTSPSAATTVVTITVSSTTATAPTSIGAAASKNGRCGSRNGGTTCKGYKGRSLMEECCRVDGSCGAGVLACGMGCQKMFGNCWW